VGYLGDEGAHHTEEGGAAGRAPVLLVAYGAGPMSDAQLHLACRSAADIGGGVRVLHVVVRTRHMPLDAPLTLDERARAEAVLDRAERIVGRYGMPCHLDVVQARSVGEAIVCEARDHGAHTIFIGLRDRDRPHARILLSGTVRQVLRNAPCPVQIGYLPAALPDEAGREAAGEHDGSAPCPVPSGRPPDHLYRS